MRAVVKSILFAYACLLPLSIFAEFSAQEATLISHVQESIALAQQEASKLTDEILAIPGMSSAKVRHLLNNLCSMEDTRYLEVGVWQGSTFISALYDNEGASKHAVAIDNWSEFGGPFPEFLAHVLKFLPNYEGKFFSADCFTVNKNTSFSQKVNTYFYDGNHSFLSQKKAFTYFNDVLEDVFIAIVDDWNFPEVQKGTRAAFRELKYQILFETVLPARYNGDLENWWNGFYVAVIRKPN